jgi:hypothetical protein
MSKHSRYFHSDAVALAKNVENQSETERTVAHLFISFAMQSQWSASCLQTDCLGRLAKTERDKFIRKVAETGVVFETK